MSRRKVTAFVILLVFLILYIGGCGHAGSWLVKEDGPVHADAIILLMGSVADRVLQTADMYNTSMADRLIIVKEGMGAYKKLEERGAKYIGNTEQVTNALHVLGIHNDSITVLPGDALSTLSEAIIVRKFLTHNPGIDTVMIVTSATHSRRASIIFKTAFRKKDMPLHVVTIPSTYSAFEPEQWWRRKEDIQKVLSEYVKIASFVLIEKRHLN